MKKTPKSSQLIFSTHSYPTFGRSKQPFDDLNPPKTVANSPYYWWFMFLRLNTEYKATCESKGMGNCAELYKDFGDIFKVNFKDWWKAKAHLFAEPKIGYRMLIANTEDELAPFNSKEVVNLVVPLTWSRRSLLKSFTSHVLNKIEKGKRGVSVVESEAAYRLGSRWNVEAFKSAYNIYIEKQKSLIEDKKVAWADIAIRAGLAYAIQNKLQEGITTRHNVDLRATLTVLANRHFKRAENFIRSAATNNFSGKK